MPAVPIDTLSDDHWKAFYLFTCEVSEQTCDSSPQPPLGDDSDLGITRFNTPGEVAGWRKHGSVIHTKAEETKERVEDYLHEVEPFYGYYIHRLLAKLKPEFAKDLIADRSMHGQDGELAGFNLKINAVTRALCSRSPAKDYLDGYGTAQHVFYIEPKLEIAPFGLPEEAYRPLIEAARRYFDVEGNTETPVILEDMILLPGIGYGNHNHSCVALRLAPLSDAGGFLIPLIPTQILNHIAICGLKEHMARDLRSLPISGDSFWEMFTTMRSFRSYREDYLSQRAQAENLIQRATEVSRVADSRFPAGFIYEGDYEEFVGKLKLRNPHSWWASRSMKQIFQGRRRSADDALEHALLHIRERIRSLDDFLHDAALADLSDTNLRLARTVGRLTWIVLWISLLSLLVGLVPDARKEAYFNALVALPNAAAGSANR